jgi:hypothetical protein
MDIDLEMKIRLVSKIIFNFLLASNHCRLLRAKLWDIQTVDEFDYVLGRIYAQTHSFDSPRIAVNFTKGKRRKFCSISILFI